MSNESKHTPGPFEVSMGAGGTGGLFVRDAKRRLIAGFQTTSLSDEILPDEGEANARLFEAAGDMLAALKADNELLMKLAPLVFKTEIAEHIPFGLKEEVQEWLRQSKSQAALAKAEVSA